MNMPEVKQNMEDNKEKIDAGASILSWETWEYPPVVRSRRWYIIASTLGLALLLYAIITANFVFAVIIIMFAVITLMRDIRKPDRVQIHLTTGGVVFGHDFYPYQDVRDFSIIYNPPDVKTLYVAFHGALAPTLTVPLEDMNPNDVRKALLPYAFENLNREREYLTDILSRLYKL